MINNFGPLKVGIGGPVGAGKTSLTEALCKKLSKKIVSSILRHINSTQNTFTHKSIRFSNNYAFLNSKTTLLKNYRTVKSS